MWFIQLRLGGKSIPITNADKKQCEKEAAYLKAEYKAGKRIEKSKEPEKPCITLDQAIKDYCELKSNVLSPVTIRGYQNIRKNQLKSIMQKNIYDLIECTDIDWQKIVNEESGKFAPKTVKNSVSFVKTVIQEKTKKVLPTVKLPAPVDPDKPFLQPEEIPIFVSAAMKTDVAVPALLALSSMRVSEIQALDWKNIKKNPDFIRTNGAVVPDENHKMVYKKQNKNLSSARDVPILIPELKTAIEKNRQPSGPVMTCSRSHLLKMVHRICQENKITDVDIHGLRHSFASLAYHLGIPEKITQDIGGWKDSGTMHKIYTHVARKDISRYQTALADFYNPKKESEKAGQ